MDHARSRMLIYAVLAIVLLLLAAVLCSWLVWGWPSFEVEGFSWS